MTKKDKGEFIRLIANGFQEVMIPALEDFEGRLTNKLASKEELGEIGEDVKEIRMQVDSIDRKFTAERNRHDRQSVKIEGLEKRVVFLEAASL